MTETAPGGVGISSQHAADLFDPHGIGFFEVHAEEVVWVQAARRHALLRRVRQSFPLSVHGVGLSIGGAGPLCKEHLRRLKRLIERYEPALFSEHLGLVETTAGRFSTTCCGSLQYRNARTHLRSHRSGAGNAAPRSCWKIRRRCASASINPATTLLR